MTFKANDSLTEQIAQYLGKQIIQGTMQAGERIQELRIASELEVSRGSVREALLILQRRHLVEIFPRRGAVVSSITGQDVRHFFELWFLLLDQAVCNLATSWQNDDLAHFFEVTTQLAECNRKDDLQGFYEHGVDFLDTLYLYAGNRYLEHTLKDLLPLTQRCLFAILRAGKSQMDQTQLFLENLLKTIIARDTAKLRQMVAEFGQQYSQLAQSAAESLSGRH
ncbi:GntR family transcriptional regulator [Chromobacterium haemolyticum]|uniref:GntR family transcriptional regulator n=1 Tax=Chromobacterium fluminis TaxID=3044269 RepID=A0ABX0KWR4_9NEIS|nr:GntR family transcriptional regulator [Chromobacterium haemolyticum]NHR03984.1 GntR family transcriptional regulator [Chromobacterium haemolyticum]OQS44735.1 GntR family transcriptional regulator [Chromobacterium haemolyticum]